MNRELEGKEPLPDQTEEPAVWDSVLVTMALGEPAAIEHSLREKRDQKREDACKKPAQKASHHELHHHLKASDHLKYRR